MCFSDVNHFAKIISRGISSGAPRRRRRYRQSIRRNRSEEFRVDKKTLQICGLQRAYLFSCGIAPSPEALECSKPKTENPLARSAGAGSANHSRKIRIAQNCADFRPPWMAEVPKMQEHFSADRHGWRTLAASCLSRHLHIHVRRKCRKRRSIFRPTAMDGGSAENAGAFFGARGARSEKQNPPCHHGGLLIGKATSKRALPVCVASPSPAPRTLDGAVSDPLLPAARRTRPARAAR